MIRSRAWRVGLAVLVGLPLAWLLVRGSWARKPVPAPHRSSVIGLPAQDTTGQTGLRLLREGRPQEALASLREAARTSPGNAIVLNNLCVAEIQVGEFGVAVRDCERAVAMDPDFELARNNLAWARAERLKAVTSVESREAAAPGTRSASDWMAVGMDWYRLAEWDRSLECFERALREQPGNATALNDIGAVWMEKGHPERAVGYFERALDAEPDHWLARNNLAWARDELGKATRQPGGAR